MTQPQRLGKYELVEVLGRGAMGIVYKAFDPDIHRTVAIKTIRKELVEDDDRAGMMLARFRNEARAAGRLSHPGIVAVYDFGESSAVTYIAMEFVQGNSLREYFNRGTRFAERDAVSIMAQLLDALQHAHEQGVWHRDIKPANLIIMNNGRLKIADFGIARIDTSQLTLTGVVLGSPGYMAPEQYSGGTVDWRADLFAAGVVMYQLLTGVRAFTGTTEQIAYKICHEHPPAPSAADPARGWERYDAVVAQGLAKRPEERFPSATAFRTALLEAYAAPVSPTVSEETIIVEPTVPGALLEPSNPSARTSSGATPLPLSVPPLERTSPPAALDVEPRSLHETPARGIPQARDGATGTVAAIGRKWPIAAGAVAGLALFVVGAVLLRSTPETQQPPRPKAPAVARAAPQPPPQAEPGRPAARPPEPATAKPAAKPEPPKTAKPVAKPEPPKTARPASGEQPRRAPATAQAGPTRPEPEHKVAAAPAPAATPPKPASPPPSQNGGFWSDQGLQLRVQSKLQFSRSLWRASGGIVVAARNGVVTLTGTVPAHEDVAEAQRIAGAVEGVRSVRNELKVGPVQ
jgi:serine/threonine-protein kinase